jgi:VWFA-related protein
LAALRDLALAGLLVAASLPALCARRTTVAQLEEALAADVATHRADAEVARQVSEMELTERLTQRMLGHVAATQKLGPRTALALQLLSDQSSFLDPPTNELPATAFPDDATQRHMLDAARAYSVQTWTRLPNFFVTRMTNRFDDGPHVLVQGDWPVRAGMQPAGTSSREVTFRDGKEAQDSTAAVATAVAKPAQEVGLRSWGEFGPALFVVLSDSAKGKVTFSHWEELAAAPSKDGTVQDPGPTLAAVYRYAVPRTESHYQVNYCCVRDAKSIGGPRVVYGGGRNQGPSQYLSNSVSFQPFVETPGYHGSISIDPATGTVLRITIETELSRFDPLKRAAIAIEYGPVRIGDASFIAPVRSVALSTEDAEFAATNGSSASESGRSQNPAWTNVGVGTLGAPLQLINETRFVAYHRLGSTARILADTAATGADPVSPDSSRIRAAGDPAAAPTPTSGTPPTAASTPTLGQPDAQTAVVGAPASPVAPAAQPAPAEPVIPEVSMTAARGVPEQPADAQQAGGDGFSLKVTSRLVDVGLVAYDKKGHPVRDLKPDEVEVYDNGRKQEVRSFGLAGDAQPSAAALPPGLPAPPATEETATFANRPSDEAGAPVPSEGGSTVLVIDESHIAWSDMNYARGQVLKFLRSLKPGERVGLYAMTGLGFRVLTEVSADHAALIAHMEKFLPSAQSVAEAQDEETRNRQHFDEVQNVADLNSVNGNHNDVPDGQQPVDPQLLTMGDNPARASFMILAQVARHLSSIPGHKKVVWVSSDNVLADWQDQSVGIDKSPKDVSGFALRAQEAMNDAHAAVYPFDVSQLESAAITADLQHQNVELTPAASEAASLGGGQTASRNTTPGRVNAELSQDLHPVQGPVRQVAAATGGRVIRRAGDLAAQLDDIVADGHATYLLSFSPGGPADGQYHTISLKLNGRRGLTLRYRTGYLFEKEPATLRERFQQAVWRPMDASDIAVKASVVPQDRKAEVKINIATGDLGLRQQAGRWMDKLDIFFIQRDDAGLHARVEGQTLGLRLMPATYEKLMPTGVPFEQLIGAKPGMGSLRVLVVDENSGRMGSVTIPLSAMEAGGGR